LQRPKYQFRPSSSIGRDGQLEAIDTFQGMVDELLLDRSTSIDHRP
jgi:hypothetical protein